MSVSNEEATKAGMAVVAQLEIKDRDYGSSWRKYEGLSAFFNLSRKWDRMETQAKSRGNDIIVMANDARRDGCRDDLTDFVGYGLLTHNFLSGDRKVSRFDLMPADIEKILSVELDDDWDEFGGTGIWINMIKAWRRLIKMLKERKMDLWETLEGEPDAQYDFEYLMSVSMRVLAMTESTKSMPIVEAPSQPRGRKPKDTAGEGEEGPRRNFGWKTTDAGKRALLRGYIYLRGIASEEQLVANFLGTYTTAQAMAAFIRNAVPEVFTEYQATMGKPVEDEVLFERFRKMWSQGSRTTEHPWKNHALKEHLLKDTSFSDHERTLFQDEVDNPMAGVVGK